MTQQCRLVVLLLCWSSAAALLFPAVRPVPCTSPVMAKSPVRCTSPIMGKKGGKPKSAKTGGGRKGQGQQEKKAVRDQRQEEFSKQFMFTARTHSEHRTRVGS